MSADADVNTAEMCEIFARAKIDIGYLKVDWAKLSKREFWLKPDSWLKRKRWVKPDGWLKRKRWVKPDG